MPLAPGAGRPRNRTPRPRFWRERTPRSARRTRAPEGTPRSPRPLSRRSRARSTSTSTSRRVPSTCFGLRWSAASCPASAHGKWWARRSSRPPGATCAGSARASSRGGTRLLQITGWHKDKATCLQLVMDEPPEQLYNQWIRDRMEFYKQVEPTDPPKNERLVLGDASTPRMRFSSSNGLGDVSTALWSVILSNPEKSGLAAIHSVAKEALGRVSLPFWRWRSIFTPHRDLGASGPVLGGGRCWGVSFFFWGVLCSQWFPPCFNTPRLPVASNRRLHNLAAPRTGRIGHCLKKVAAAESGFPEVPWGFLGIPRRVNLPSFRGSCWGFLVGGFDFWALLGCVWPACPMCIRHSVGLEHSCSSPRPGRSREARTLVFSMVRVFTQFLLRPPYTRLWDRIPRVFWDTGPDVPAPWHGRGGEAAGRGASPPIRSTPGTLGHSGGHFNGLVASVVGRLPQPLSAGDLADLWDSLWLLLMAAADGKLSENFFSGGE